jgi:hypothetical protein
MVDWATALDQAGKFGEREQLILQLAVLNRVG